MTVRPPAIALALMLAGCTVGPDYMRPSVPLPASFRASSHATRGDRAWWRAFGDPTLEALETEALAGNLTIEAALARVDQARGQAGIADAAAQPSASLDASVARSRQSLNAGLGQLSRFVPDFGRTVDNGRIVLAASWELDFAGGIRRREASRAGLVESEAGVAAARLAVTADLADAYMILRATQAQRDALRRATAMLDDQRAIMAVRVRTGAAPADALYDMSARVRDSEAQMPALDARIAAARNRIAVLMGRSPSIDDPRLATDVALVDAPDPAIGVPADILRTRPDVAAAEARLVEANAGIGAALAQYYPSFSLSAVFGFESNRLGQLASGDSNVAQGAFGLHWRLFDFARIANDVRVARGRNREALAAYRDAVLRASQEVEDAFAQLTSVRARLAALDEQRAQLAAIAANTRRAFALGATSRDISIGADRAVVAQDLVIAGAQGDVARAVIACHRALGGGTSSPDLPS